MIISVTIEDRGDDGIRVFSDDLPGLILAGRNRPGIIAAIEPAAREILKRKGIEPSVLRIDAITNIDQHGLTQNEKAARAAALADARIRERREHPDNRSGSVSSNDGVSK
jgi:hypothetical protein